MSARVTIFDCDGTLYDDRAAYAQFRTAFETFLRERRGVAPAEVWSLRDELRAQSPTANSISLLADHLRIDRDEMMRAVYGAIDLEAIGVRRDEQLRRFLEQHPAMHVLWSNNPRLYVERVLHAIGVVGCFERVCTAEDLSPYKKPEEEAYQRVAEWLPAHAAICFVENDVANLLPAIAVGWEAVLLVRGAVPEALPPRIRVIRSLREL